MYVPVHVLLLRRSYLFGTGPRGADLGSNRTELTSLPLLFSSSVSLSWSLGGASSPTALPSSLNIVSSSDLLAVRVLLLSPELDNELDARAHTPSCSVPPHPPVYPALPTKEARKEAVAFYRPEFAFRPRSGGVGTAEEMQEHLGKVRRAVVRVPWGTG